ncbi:hypothetical protein QEN58_09775 [Halomonas alkaliantarctica]|uniref:Immunity protein 49 of polymorphic toxin system n=1 Tax=Halomonas alkaliantarctica TaxID=232346 RepID=A0ABY8LH30_9GAMM|nr:hypothetical protein [Halomonas alkaliantarctica]WGI23645.1 hypothetical protein QEN58_09775 [Halomonas alkaliantarctica]
MKVITKEHEKVEYGKSKAGIVIHNFLSSFDETFNQSSYAIFSEFFKKNENVSKWMIFSDYVLNDKNKPNDVITFSILPYSEDFERLKEKINGLSFKDIKNLSRVNTEFLEFINKSEILNISILIDKNMTLDPINEREALKTCYKTAINQVDYWIRNEGENENYLRIKKAYNVMLHEVSKQGVNLRNIRNIEIVSNFIAYITFQACLLLKVDIIGWFSDRDSMLTHKDGKFSMPVIFDLAYNLFHALMLSKDKDYAENFVFGLPEQTGDLWYDSFNRIPDLIAATLADYDYENNISSHSKFFPVIENVITNKEKNLIYKIYALENGFEAAYLTFTRQEDKMPLSECDFSALCWHPISLALIRTYSNFAPWPKSST